jgi:hypothetical protein
MQAQIEKQKQDLAKKQAAENKKIAQELKARQRQVRRPHLLYCSIVSRQLLA